MKNLEPRRTLCIGILYHCYYYYYYYYYHYYYYYYFPFMYVCWYMLILCLFCISYGNQLRYFSKIRKLRDLWFIFLFLFFHPFSGEREGFSLRFSLAILGLFPRIYSLSSCSSINCTSIMLKKKMISFIHTIKIE